MFYGNAGKLEFDLVVAPGADPGATVLAFDGAEPSLNPDGWLLLGDVILEAPVIY